MLRIFNTLSEQIDPFKPREKKRVKMYTCGPSLYRQPHIGNYRTFLFEDILQRYLEYLGYEVLRLVTFTDIEDKAITEAKTRELSIKDLTQENAAIFQADSKLLSIMPPLYNPRSSTTINQAVKLIQILLEKSLAYWHNGSVYFDPLKFKGFGKLSRLDMTRWPQKTRRFHKDTYPGMRWNLGDFVLWHGEKGKNEISWETAIGTGRPAWNVQDGAMVTKHLGFAIDIACGGRDNLIRHHDYNIAVIEGVSGEKFAQYWLHCAHLLISGKKMSKSRSNVYYPNDLLKMGYKKEHIRFYLIYGTYRKRLNFTLEKFEKVCRKLENLKTMVGTLQRSKSLKPDQKDGRYAHVVDAILSSFKRNMNNDLNVKAAFNSVFKLFTKLLNLEKQGKLGLNDARIAITNLQAIDKVLQVIF